MLIVMFFILGFAMVQEGYRAELAGMVESAFDEPLVLLLLLGTMGGIGCNRFIF